MLPAQNWDPGGRRAWHRTPGFSGRLCPMLLLKATCVKHSRRLLGGRAWLSVASHLVQTKCGPRPPARPSSGQLPPRGLRRKRGKDGGLVWRAEGAG